MWYLIWHLANSNAIDVIVVVGITYRLIYTDRINSFVDIFVRIMRRDSSQPEGIINQFRSKNLCRRLQWDQKYAKRKQKKNDSNSKTKLVNFFNNATFCGAVLGNAQFFIENANVCSLNVEFSPRFGSDVDVMVYWNYGHYLQSDK